MKLKTKIYLLSITILIVIFSVLGSVIYTTQKKALESDLDERMRSHLDDFYTILNDHVNLKQKSVNVSLNLAESIFSTAGKLVESNNNISVEGVNQITKETKTYNIKEWRVDGKPLYNNFDIVDLIKDKSVETATIFQKIDDGYLRISTNVMKLDGNRAVGTFIPNSSSVIQTVEKGETFFGRAFVVNDWYLTAYQPIKIDGEVKGILYVGLKEKDHDFLKSVFVNKKYFKNGYPFMVNKQGDLVIHPSKEGENFADAQFFNQIINAKEGQYSSRYLWPENSDGKWKYQYFKYFEPYESYISFSIYEEDINYIINRLLIIIIACVIAAVVLFFLSLTMVLNPVIKRVVEATEFAQNISNGDLVTKLEVNNSDEIGKLSITLQEMQEKLKRIIFDIHYGAENILSTSLQLSASSQQVSQSASEQASSVEEVSATVEQFSANISQNSDNSIQTEKISNLAMASVREGSGSSEVSVKSMKEIADKITIINDIAFQTNILALNAAVEAARAGEHGKGFAVVAAEVRKLAERSKVAAEDIDKLTRLGVEVSEKAGSQLSQIIPEIEKTTQLVKEIASTSSEMGMGCNQVGNAIEQLNGVSQQNAATAEELSAGAENLSEQAEKLKESISFFRLDDKIKSKTDVLKDKKILSKNENIKKDTHKVNKEVVC